MWHEYRDVFNRLNLDPEIRAIVLSGAGPRAFTAGLDLHSMPNARDGALDPARAAWKLKDLIRDWQDSISASELCSKPVISVLHGICFGLAIDIACATDIRLAARDAKLSVKEVDIGIAADIGTLSRLPNIVGSHSWVKEVTLTARVFDAAEAERVGFVSRVLGSKEEAVAEGLRLAGLMAEKSPLAVQGTKKLVDYSRDEGVRRGLEFTQVWNAGMIQTEDTQKAIGATLSKKKATFAKL